MKSTTELKREIEVSKAKMFRKFCPIIKDSCRRDCACFEGGEIKKIAYSDGSQKERAQVAWCSHPFIGGTGVIAIENY